MTPSLSHARPIAVVAGLLLACAAPRQPWREAVPPEVMVEVLPREATLTVDGVAVGAGSRVVAVPDPEHVYRLGAAAPGFAPAERSSPGARLAGGRVALVLRPDGFGAARRLELEDGAGLAGAAAVLERAGRHGQALEYAERAVEAGPELPLGHRVLADAALALGRRQRAIQEYSAYLQLAPDAPDRTLVARRVEELRGDLTIPGVDP